MFGAHFSRERLRSGLFYFAGGKTASAALGIANFTLIVRLLSIESYGVYVALYAAFEIALALSTFGLDWAAIRYLPELRAAGMARAGTRLAVRLCVLRLVSLLAVALLGYAATQAAAGLIGTPASENGALRVLLWLLVAEGMARFLTACVFETMLMQAAAQACVVVRAAVLTALLAAAASTGAALGLEQLMTLELAASVIGLALAGALFARSAFGVRGADAAGRDGPSLERILSIAGHNYLSALISFPLSAPFLLLICNRFVAPAEMAVLGFARNVSELIRRYLPAELLIGFVRPLFVAAWTTSRDFRKVNDLATLAWKVTALTLAPVICCAAVLGEPILAWLSGGKYGDAYALTLALICLLALHSHAVLLGNIANTVERPELLTRTGLIATLTMLPFGAALALGWGAYAFLIGIAAQEVVVNACLIGGLRKSGLPYRSAWTSLLKLILAAASVAAAALLFPAPDSELGLVLEALALTAAVIVIALSLSLLSTHDWAKLRSIAPSA